MIRFFGTGSMGGKAQNLVHNQDMILASGMEIPDSWIILSDLAKEIPQAIDHRISIEEQQIYPDACPQCLESINAQILEEMETGRPYAVRSSALDESGGTGIYHSCFFIPRGHREQDIHALWQKEAEVYASQFSEDALAWQEKNRSEAGMAVLIQPVSGFEFENFWLPTLSGVAYTSYQGLPMIRVVMGLGTRAVAGEGLVFRSRPENFTLTRSLWDLSKAAAIDLKTGHLVKIATRVEDFYQSIDYNAFGNFFVQLDKLKSNGDFSLEWTLVGDKITIVQCDPYRDKLPGDVSVDQEKFFLLAQGSDVVNSGRNQFKAVVHVTCWTSETAGLLEFLNKQMSGYLLIVPQEASSELAEMGFGNVRLGFRHFSNAVAVIESQRAIEKSEMMNARLAGILIADHTQGRGASHFQQLCSRSDILFMGTEDSLSSLLSLPGRMDYGNGLIGVWQVEGLVDVDGVNETGFVYLAKESQVSKYTPQQIEAYSFALRRAANEIDRTDRQKSAAFYEIHYLIAPYEMNPVGFDAFKFDEDIVKQYSKDQLLAFLKIVIENQEWAAGFLMDQGLDIDDFEQYLREIGEHLK